MNKAELISAMAEKTGLAKVDVKNTLNAFMEVTKESMAKGDKLALVGFGTFSVVTRAPRTARNPRTNQLMEIPAKTVVKFKIGADLAKSVQ